MAVVVVVVLVAVVVCVCVCCLFVLVDVLFGRGNVYQVFFFLQDVFCIVFPLYFFFLGWLTQSWQSGPLYITLDLYSPTLLDCINHR